jgi:hypothetical protein
MTPLTHDSRLRFCADADQQQTTQPLVLQADVEVGSRQPRDRRPVNLAHITLLERRQLLAPLARQPLDGRRAQSNLGAEDSARAGSKSLVDMPRMRAVVDLSSTF